MVLVAITAGRPRMHSPLYISIVSCRIASTGRTLLDGIQCKFSLPRYMYDDIKRQRCIDREDAGDVPD